MEMEMETATQPEPDSEQAQPPTATKKQQQQQQQPPKKPNPTSKKPKNKRPLSKKKLDLIHQKLSHLLANLRPIPVSFNQQTLTLTLAGGPHEPLFRSLNLLPFLAVDLVSPIRCDLLAELVASYDPPKHYSLVRGLRLKLSRADLGRALLLPKPPLASAAASSPEFDPAQFGGVDAVASVLCNFISTWMVFLEDAAILPAEVVTANRLVREGRPDKVDWAGMMWALVEKDILGAVDTGCCYYASHIQCLMKCQKPQLFEETEVETADNVAVVEEIEDIEDDEEGGEKCGPQSSLEVGEDGEERKRENGGASVEVEECEDLGKEEGVLVGLGQCEELGKEEIVAEMLISHCDDDFRNGEIGKGEEDKGKMVVDNNELDGDVAAAKFPTFERLNSLDFMNVMGTSSTLSFGIEQTNEEFLGIGGNDMHHHKSVGLDLGAGDSFMFGNECKRPMEEVEDHGNQQKRFCSEQRRGQSSTVDGFEGCMEEIFVLMEKAKRDMVEKDQAYMNTQVQLQYLNEAMQQKDAVIQSLETTMMEEQRKREIEGSRFVHDLRTLSNVLFGCKKALVDTQMAFAEYREKFPLMDGPRDGTVGVVLGARESGKTCLTKDEMHQIARTIVNDVNRSWCDKLNKYASRVNEFAGKLVMLSDKFHLLKEQRVKDQDQSHG